MAAAAHDSTIDLSGQVALITGGSGGLGRAFALALAAAGAKVAVMARTQAGLAEIVESIGRAGGRALPLAGDVVRAPDVARAVAAAEQHLGPVDIHAPLCNAHIPVVLGRVIPIRGLWHSKISILETPYLC